MKDIPKEFEIAWDERESNAVLTTVDAYGIPNSVWVLCLHRLNKKKILIANNSLKKTLDNIKTNPYGSLLFIAPERRAYQVKGNLEYYTDGEIFQNIRDWLDPQYPGHGVVVLTIENIFFGAEKVYETTS
jgi:predicted pyridoxine 5'-phosphate oxidase superfamily flavin-nucleotide-binding protein